MAEEHDEGHWCYIQNNERGSHLHVLSADFFGVSGLGLSSDGAGDTPRLRRPLHGDRLCHAGAGDPPVFPASAADAKYRAHALRCPCSAHALPRTCRPEPFCFLGPPVRLCFKSPDRLDRGVLSAQAHLWTECRAQCFYAWNRIQRVHSGILDPVCRRRKHSLLFGQDPPCVPCHDDHDLVCPVSGAERG